MIGLTDLLKSGGEGCEGPSTYSLPMTKQVYQIIFFIFGYCSLLATNLQEYENIAESLFTFCKARWARQKKNLSDQNTKTKGLENGMNKT